MRPTPERLTQLFGADSVGAFATDAAMVPFDVATLPVVSPASIEAACEVLRAADREAWRVLPAGAGEHLGWGAPPGAVDFALSTRRLQRVLEYEPSEMVLVTEAGTTLHAIATLAAPHAQRLASDVWPGRAATIGGAVAAGRGGTNRRGAGLLRDALLGARVVHADGRVSKTGGKVVKNVAGFDLGKLYAGSCGALAVLVEVNLRLVPRPETAALVVAHVERARAQESLLAVHRAAVAPAALLLVAGAVCDAVAPPAGRVAVVARFEGRAAAVRAQVEVVQSLLPGEIIVGERAASTWDALRASAEPRAGAVLLRLSTLPTQGLAALERLESLAAWRNGGGCVTQFGTGTGHAQLPGLAPRELRALRAGVATSGAHVAVLHAPPGFDAGDDAPLDPVVGALVRRLAAGFDPERRLRPAPGGAR